MLPYAGGSCLIYQSWKIPDTQLIPLEYPGHSMEEMLSGVRPAGDFDTLLTVMRDQLVSHMDGSGYSIFGHSMGGLVAYHLAASLEKENRPLPDILYLSGITPPDRLDISLFECCSSEQGIRDYMLRYGRLDQKRINSRIFRDHFLPVIEADFSLLSHYQDSRAAKEICKVHTQLEIIYSPEDTIMNAQNMSGWPEYSYLPVKTHEFHGDHFFIEEDTVKQEILDLISLS